MPWKPEVFVEGAWRRNGLVFATEQEAEHNASDQFMRWTLCSESRAVEVPDAVPNYTYHDRVLKPIPE